MRLQELLNKFTKARHDIAFEEINPNNSLLCHSYLLDIDSGRTLF